MLLAGKAKFAIVFVYMPAGLNQAAGITNDLAILEHRFSRFDSHDRHLVPRHNGVYDIKSFDPAAQTQ